MHPLGRIAQPDEVAPPPPSSIPPAAHRPLLCSREAKARRGPLGAGQRALTSTAPPPGLGLCMFVRRGESERSGRRGELWGGGVAGRLRRQVASALLFLLQHPYITGQARGTPARK